MELPAAVNIVRRARPQNVSARPIIGRYGYSRVSRLESVGGNGTEIIQRRGSRRPWTDKRQDSRFGGEK
jgi:hypothetical protein